MVEESFETEFGEVINDIIKKIEELRQTVDVELRSAKQKEIAAVVDALISKLDAISANTYDLNSGIRNYINAYKRELKELKKQVSALETSEAYLARTIEELKERHRDVVSQYQEGQRKLAAENTELKLMMKEPPLTYATFVRLNPDGTADVFEWNGQRMKLKMLPGVDAKQLKVGQRVVISLRGLIVSVLEECDEVGDEFIVDEILSDRLVRVADRQDRKTIVIRSDYLKEPLTMGDHVRLDRRAIFILGKLPRKESSDLVLEKIPDVTFEKIGGQKESIARLRQQIEYPFIYSDVFKEGRLQTPRGYLLFGPPGCGKTLCVQALANALKQRLKEKVMILIVRGPELLTMWVGETERKIREPFELAKMKAKEGIFVIIFFDEIEALFPTRGTFIGSAGVHETSVTQFSTMMDGIEKFANILVVGTTNRPDLIDPALTRPGRLNPVVEFPRPDKEGVKEIFGIYLEPLADLVHEKYVNPQHPEYLKEYDCFGGDKLKVIKDYFIRVAVAMIFNESEEGDKKPLFEELQGKMKAHKIITVQFEDTGDKKSFYMKDLISGVIVADAVRRMQSKAVLAKIHGQEKTVSLRIHYLTEAIEEIFEEGKVLPSRTDPNEWARIYLGIPMARRIIIVDESEEEEDISERSGKRVI